MKNYPTDFRGSTEYSKVDDKEINTKIQEALMLMKENKSSQHILFSGDTLILIMEMHKEDGGGYEIIVTSNYNHAYLDNQIFK